MFRPLFLVASVLLMAGVVAPAQANQGDVPQAGPVWEQFEGTAVSHRLFAPTSGALLVQNAFGLVRSDDGGVTWRRLRLPPGANAFVYTFAVDPTDHDTIYSGVATGPYTAALARSTDGGATWAVFELPPDTGFPVIHIAVSPANPSLVYVSRKDRDGLWHLLSRDRGATWEIRSVSRPDGACGWLMTVFAPHPTDAERVHRRAACYGNGVFQWDSTPFEHSTDQAATWTQLPGLPSVQHIVGGQGVHPERFYVASNDALARDPSRGTALLFRGDGGVDGWTQILSVPAARVEALAYDPAVPDQVYVGLKDGRILASSDGGQSWTQLGQKIASINDLVLGFDRRNLYAATTEGVWRFPLSPESGE